MGITADIKLTIHEKFQNKQFTSADFPEVEKRYDIESYNIGRNIARLVEKGQIVRAGYTEFNGRSRTLYMLAEGVSFAPKPIKPYKAPVSRAKANPDKPKAPKKESAIMTLWNAMNMPKIDDVVSMYSGLPIRKYQSFE